MTTSNLISTLSKRLRLAGLTALSCVLALSACSNEFAAAVRQVTYPPDFNYVSDTELRSGMARLGYQMQRLDLLLAETQTGRESAAIELQPDRRQQEVLAILDRMENIATGLQAGSGGSSHPFLADTMPGFVVELGAARLATARNPPSYYRAGRLSGGCTNCHRVNR